MERLQRIVAVLGKLGVAEESLGMEFIRLVEEAFSPVERPLMDCNVRLYHSQQIRLITRPETS